MGALFAFVAFLAPRHSGRVFGNNNTSMSGVAIVAAEGDRLTVHRCTENPWRAGAGSGRLRWRGVDYHELNGYAGEWMAVTRTRESIQAVGFVLDAISVPEVHEWLRRGFENVRFERDDSARVLFEECSSPVVPGWPFVPPSVFRSERGNILLYLMEYYPAEPGAPPNGGPPRPPGSSEVSEGPPSVS